MANGYLRLAPKRWKGLKTYLVDTDLTPDDAGPMPHAWGGFDLMDNEEDWSFRWQSPAERIECLVIEVIEGRTPTERLLEDAGYRDYVNRVGKAYCRDKELEGPIAEARLAEALAVDISERRILPTSDDTYYGIRMMPFAAARAALKCLPLPKWVVIVERKREGKLLVRLPEWADMEDVKGVLETGRLSNEAVLRRGACKFL